MFYRWIFQKVEKIRAVSVTFWCKVDPFGSVYLTEHITILIKSCFLLLLPEIRALHVVVVVIVVYISLQPMPVKSDDDAYDHLL